MLCSILVHGFCPLKTKIIITGTQFPGGFLLNLHSKRMPASGAFCPRLFIPEARDTGTARACLKSRLLDYDECKITLYHHSRITQT